jgi:hypothetical protein
MNRSALRPLSLTLLTVVGCADAPAADDGEIVDPYSEQGVHDDALAVHDAGQDLTLLALERSPQLTRVDDATQAIRDKLAAIPEPVRSGYFAGPISPDSTTPDGTRYRFYGGASGMGAIYLPGGPAAGGRYLFGAILSYWADFGYERGLYGYPASDPVRLGDGSASQTFRTEKMTPWTDNHGLTSVRYGVRTFAGRAGAVDDTVSYYLDSNNPGTLSTRPLECELIWQSSINTVSRDQFGAYQKLWCGPLPAAYTDPAYVDPSTDVDPSHI